MPKEKAEKEKISMKEFEAKVVELAEKGMTAEKIGESLRHEGIHPQEYGKISRILKGKGLYHPPEIKNIQEKLERVTKHKEKHGQDKRAMRERERIFSLLRKQKKYHKIA
ncbi:MAG: hypothetical protein AABX50_01110 [Nanoarchaeota archaeon]